MFSCQVEYVFTISNIVHRLGLVSKVRHLKSEFKNRNTKRKQKMPVVTIIGLVLNCFVIHTTDKLPSVKQIYSQHG